MHRSLQHCSLVRGANYIAERIDQKAEAEHLTEAITATYAINVDLQSISLRRKWSFRQAYLKYVGPRVQIVNVNSPGSNTTMYHGVQLCRAGDETIYCFLSNNPNSDGIRQ